MSIELTYPHIEKSVDGTARLGRVPRVRVAQVVMDYFAHGWSAEEMCRQHSSLRPAEVHAALAYCFDHAGEIDSEIEAERGLDETLTSQSPFFLQMRKAGKL